MLLLPSDDILMQYCGGGGGGGSACAKFKERYNAYGYPDIYGGYDRNGRYRVTDIYYNTPPDDTQASDSHSTSSGDEKEEDDESSGEYPPDYFARIFSGGGVDDPGSDDYMMYSSSSSNNNNNNNNSDRNGYSRLQMLQQAMVDIRAVLTRPTLVARNEGDDAIMQVAMIRAIMSRCDDDGTVQQQQQPAAAIIPTPKRLQKEEPVMTVQPAKKRLKLAPHNNGDSLSYSPIPPSTIDQIYMSRVGDTDCFNCMLCDPFKLKEIRLPAWNNHCVSQIHCMKRDNETQQKNLYGS